MALRGTSIDPRKKFESTLDSIAKGVSVAKDILGTGAGIVEVMNKLDQTKIDAAKQKLESEKLYTVNPNNVLLSGATEVKPGTPGSFAAPKTGEAPGPDGNPILRGWQSSGINKNLIGAAQAGKLGAETESEKVLTPAKVENIKADTGVKKANELKAMAEYQNLLKKGGKGGKSIEALDTAFVKTIPDWLNKAKPQLENSINSLDQVISEMKDPKQRDTILGIPIDTTGKAAGGIGHGLAGSVMTPKSVARRDKVVSEIFKSVKETFGGQPSLKEVEALVKTAWNDYQPLEISIEKVQNLRDKLKYMKESRDSSYNYFLENDTMDKYTGYQPMESDFMDPKWTGHIKQGAVNTKSKPDTKGLLDKLNSIGSKNNTSTGTSTNKFKAPK